MARIFRIVTGFTLLLAGVFMLVLPGPGILTIIAGLTILATDIEWARRLNEWVKGKASSLRSRS
jgi:uncharacterized protein (TIGR02611 family)